jgi:hypothetical protein
LYSIIIRISTGIRKECVDFESGRKDGRISCAAPGATDFNPMFSPRGTLLEGHAIKT